MTRPVERYLTEMARIRSSDAAVKETSYYPALSNLLNEVGKKIKPQVTCVMPISNQGAGLPDGGLFTQDQIRKGFIEKQTQMQLPARGVIEVKGTNDDAWVTAESTQVSRYWQKYHLVLVTNYRDFLLIGQNKDGCPIRLESFRLATNESDFWAKATTPRSSARIIGERFEEYLKRVMLQAAPLREPRDIAWFLASYAREAKARIEGRELQALSGLREALEQSLGLKFRGVRGDQFFRSSLIQTLFYGVFSAWVLWVRDTTIAKTRPFGWKESAWILKVPMVKELFEQIAMPSKLGQLGVIEILDRTEDVLNRVDQKAFFKEFEDRQAVEYFYEPFLEAFDPELKKNLGVWYTPPEIVEYMVTRVDTVLKEELEVKQGLADPNVYVLDPAAGTGSYLVAILRRIYKTLIEERGDALVASDLKRAALERIHGFEIMPAPFIVAHLQVGRLLQDLGAYFESDRNSRIGIYLTNALTGWGPSDTQQKSLAFPELEREREDADRVKKVKPILVILGNPPYNAFAGVSPKEEQGLVEPYKEHLISDWGIKKFNLDDPYVRFLRIAERKIVEQTGRGIVCYISNLSYLSQPSFVIIRKRFMKEFDDAWIDCLNGSSRETGKLTPDGKPDPSIFSTRRNPEGIKLGTAVGLFLRKSNEPQLKVRFRNLWGTRKKEELLDSLKTKDFEKLYVEVSPRQENRLSFRPSQVSPSYYTWPSLEDLPMIAPLNGPVEMRGNSLIKFDADRARFQTLESYLDPKLTNDQVRLIVPRMMRSSGEFDAEKARSHILKKKLVFSQSKIVRYYYKPLDPRVAYLDPDLQPLFSRPNPDLVSLQTIPGNSFIISRDSADKSPEGPPFYYSSSVCDRDCISGHGRLFPMLFNNEYLGKQRSLGEKRKGPHSLLANLSPAAQAYLDCLGTKLDPKESAERLWLHVLAVGFSPRYLAENKDAIRDGWPRVPLPGSGNDLSASADLGKQVSELLDTDCRVAGVTISPLRQELAATGVLTKVGGGSLQPGTPDLELTADWGHGTEAVMPGSGKVSFRDYSVEEASQMNNGAEALGLTWEELEGALGDKTYDIFLNDVGFWRNVPERVWEYMIGGYPVFKKWLSYHEFDVLGRALTVDEARHGTAIVRRIGGICILQSSLDKNYEQVKSNTFNLRR